MRKFPIQTLGCKVNHYESEQMATLLRGRGWVQTEPAEAELRIVHTCSVTVEAASKSRQVVRRSTRLPKLGKTVVTGCWATSNPDEAKNIPGVDAVVTNHESIAEKLERLIGEASREARHSLPLLDERQARHQRAFLKIQDGCDAHCTYCIIPSLRPTLSSKLIDEAVNEARRLVDAGHGEIVLTGIFLSAFGQETALRRRQSIGTRRPLVDLIRALCTRVPGLHRLRLSSLEPGDLEDDLLAELSLHEQIMPHFHLPLQSGSDSILRRMNRQYRRDDFLRMIDRVQNTFDRPALTTDIIVGFPGEGEGEFEQTIEIAERAGFIHIHAFPFSPRPGTAAARWTSDFVRGPVVGERIDRLIQLACRHSHEFRQSFLGQDVQIAVERDPQANGPIRHGRCERYFDVEFAGNDTVKTGDLISVRVERVTADTTFGRMVALPCFS